MDPYIWFLLLVAAMILGLALGWIGGKKIHLPGWLDKALAPMGLGNEDALTGEELLEQLDEDTLVRVLKEPRNSLVKQYKALLGMDNVELVFTDEALRAIARKTIERKSGARGLRSVMEEILIPIMYQVPNDPTIVKVTITPETVAGGEPVLEYGAVRKRYKGTVPVV